MVAQACSIRTVISGCLILRYKIYEPMDRELFPVFFFICKTGVVKNKNWQRYSFGVFNNVNFIGNIVFNN